MKSNVIPNTSSPDAVPSSSSSPPAPPPLQSCIRSSPSTSTTPPKAPPPAAAPTMRPPPSLSPPHRTVRRSSSVSFSHVRIREHGRTVGDNPSVSSGPALDLTWEYNESIRPLEEYEHHRTFVQPRRSKSCLILQRGEREKMLKCDYHVARSEIASAVRSINRVKANRRQTLNNMKFSAVEEVWEKIKRNGRRIFGMKKSTGKEIEDLWKNAERNLERIKMKRSRHGRSSFSASSDTSSTVMNSVSVKGDGRGRKSNNGKRVGNSSGSNHKGQKNSLLDESCHYKSRDIDLHLSRHVKKYDLYGTASDNTKVEKQHQQQDFQDDTVTPTTSNHGWSHEQFDQLHLAHEIDKLHMNIDNKNNNGDDAVDDDGTSSQEESTERVCVMFGCSDDSNHHPNIQTHPNTQPMAFKSKDKAGKKYRNDHDSDSDGLTLTTCTASMDLSASFTLGGEITVKPGTNAHSKESLMRKRSNPIIAVEEEDHCIGVDS